MSLDLRSVLERHAAALPERPASFAARGLATPFTAPLLAGARLRCGATSPAELVLPAFGGRGVYVLDWPSCLSLCSPSLHDRQLWERLVLLPRPTPAAVRMTACEVAALGYAGRAAQAAARTALRAAESARQALGATLAAQTGRRLPDALLERLAGILVETGIAPDKPGLIRRHLAAMEGFVAEVDTWLPDAPTLDAQRGAAVALGAARLTLAAVHGCLATLWLAVADPTASLTQGEAGMPGVAELAERPDWLLDGWPATCALWQAAPPAGRAAVLSEIMAIIPIPPVEADGWPGPIADWDGVIRLRRLVRSQPAWASGHLLELTARNERQRAIAA